MSASFRERRRSPRQPVNGHHVAPETAVPQPWPASWWGLIGRTTEAILDPHGPAGGSERQTPGPSTGSSDPGTPTRRANRPHGGGGVTRDDLHRDTLAAERVRTNEVANRVRRRSALNPLVQDPPGRGRDRGRSARIRFTVASSQERPAFPPGACGRTCLRPPVSARSEEDLGRSQQPPSRGPSKVVRSPMSARRTGAGAHRPAHRGRPPIGRRPGGWRWAAEIGCGPRRRERRGRESSGARILE